MKGRKRREEGVTRLFSQHPDEHQEHTTDNDRGKIEYLSY